MPRGFSTGEEWRVPVRGRHLQACWFCNILLRWFPPHPPGSRDQQAEKSTDEHGDGSTAEPCPGSDQPRMEARAVHNETRWTNSSPAAISRQQLIQGDRQVADADGRGGVD